MRVVQVISDYLPHEWGGTQIHVRDLARALRSRGNEVEVFTALRGREHEEYAITRSEWEGVAVTRVTNNLLDADRLAMMVANPKLDARFDAYLHETRPDLVHFHHFTGLATSLVEVCEARGVPCVITLHDYWLLCPRGQRLHPVEGGVCVELDRSRCLRCLNRMWPELLPVEERADFADPRLLTSPSRFDLERWDLQVRKILGMARRVIAPAAFHRERFLEWGLAPERCVVIQHGLDTRALRAEPRGKRPIATLGFLGTAIPSKGVHVLLEAFQALGRSGLALAIHGRFQVYHGDTGYEARLRAAVRPGEDVRFHGGYRQDQVASVLAGIDLLVVPSLWWETFGLTLREGALAGLPVVASDIGGLHEAIEQGLALGFAPGDAADLARVLARLIDEPELRDRMSRTGVLVREMAECAAETEQLYRGVLAGAGARPS